VNDRNNKKMKSNTYITILLALLLPFLSLSQVKVGDNPTTIDGSALLELESTNKGFLSPRMSEVQMNGINSPADGLMVYCTDCSPKGFYYFDGVSWKRILGPKSEVSTNGTAVVSSYGDAACSGGSGTITGSMTVKNAVSGVTMELYADVTQVGTWSITAIQNGVTFTASDTFTTTGCQLVTLTGTGTAVESGEFTWSTNTAPSGNATATVNPDNSSGGAAAVVSYGAMGCSGGEGSISGTMNKLENVSGVTMELYADVTEVGSWSLEATENGVTFSGSGTFATTGCQAITLTASGTPVESGAFTWTTSTNPSGSSTATVNAPPAPPNNAAGTGSFTGRVCFDIALSNDGTNSCPMLTGRQVQQADFTESGTHTQTYIFTPSGTVSNVRFTYVNANGIVITDISGDNTGNNISDPVAATVNYSTNLNVDALGLTNSNPLTADIYVIYNDGATNNGTDHQIKLTAKVKDCSCCGAYLDYHNGVWKEFMCHNLASANTNADPFSPSWEIIGGYWQWGRKGPNSSQWLTTNNSNFAHGPTGPTSSDANEGAVGFTGSLAGDNSWRNDIKTGNDPCPAGYRIPTNDDYNNLISQNIWLSVGSWSDNITNYSSGKKVGFSLFLPAAGHRQQQVNWPGNMPGKLLERGRYGFYWSSHWTNNGSSQHLSFTNAASSIVVGQNGNNRGRGMSIRCIAE
jgi:uncharacterized protein (TIGR02145 family)